MTTNYGDFASLFGNKEKRVQKLEQKLRAENPTKKANFSPTENAYNSLTGQRLDIGLQPFFFQGTIVDAIAYCKFYKVQVDRVGTIGACDLTHSSLEVTGSKILNTYVPGTVVWLMWNQHMPFAMILGAMPNFMLSPLDALSDFISQGSNVGLNVDQVHNFPFSLSSGGGIVDWSSGRPFDSIHNGEYGAITETGIRLFLDPFMLQLSIDEETGIYGFYDDQMLRVAGHNLDTRSAGYERTDHDDENEFNVIQGYNAYLWEAKGGFTQSSVLYRTLTNAQAQNTEQYYSTLEPKEDDQQPIHRMRYFNGYLGQGCKRTLFILPDTNPDLEEMPNETKYVGVAEENWGMDGLISFRSAKAVIIAKRALIPQPKQLKVDGDPTGDNSTNYKANGVYGTGPTPNIGDIADGSGAPTNLIRASAFLDLYSHAFNWRGQHPFYYHTLDWYMPDETDYDFSSSMINGNPTFSNLQSNQYLAAPTPFEFKVDDRYGNVHYFPNDSYIALLEDGGIAIGDGYGAELKMVGGSIFRSAPGDIWDLPGKNMNCLAGNDIIQRANFNVELSANFGNARIKADQKVMIMGGNDLCGGVLIESKADGISYVSQAPDDEIIAGIVLRAKNSDILLYSTEIDMVLNTEGPSANAINIDAGLSGQIITKCNNFTRLLTSSCQDVFIDGTVNEYWSDNALIGSNLRVNGNEFVSGCILCASNIVTRSNVVAGLFETANAGTTTAINAAVSDINARIVYLSEWVSTVETNLTQLQDNTDALKVEFFFRSSTQYNTSSLILFESRWQQMARLQGDSVDAWTEHPVTGVDAFAGIETYPYPGKDAWVTNESLYKQDLTLFDLSTNLMEDRPYDTPQYDNPSQAVLNGTYTVIKNPC